MKKGIRIIVASLLLVGILFLARNQIAWAGNAPVVNNAAGHGQNQPIVQQDVNADPGSVKPPPVVAPPITKAGTYPVGGVATLYVDQIADNVSIHAKLLPFAVLEGLPPGTSRYLAGVVDLTFRVDGKPVADVTSGQASVQICFAALPNITGKIYVYANNTWTALDTTLENGLVCAPASQTGQYVMAEPNP